MNAGQRAQAPVTVAYRLDVPAWCPPMGEVIDGVVYPLDGQPPPAVPHSWGDLGWLYGPPVP